jgi:aldose 1-epimerase
MRIDAGAYLPVDDELIPTGDVLRVDGTGFDFRAARKIRNGEGPAHRPYDHNFCLSAARGPLKPAAIVKGALSGVEMEVWTTEPGLQFYDGVGTARDVPGLGGVTYGAHAGFCLEAQIWPDAPNRPYFPQALLQPNEAYAQTTEYRFRLTR